MQELSPLQKLDVVLSFLVSQKSPPIQHLLDIKKAIPNIDENDLLFVLNKLNKEGLIEIEKRQVYHNGRPSEEVFYIATFDGKVNAQQGGYEMAERIKRDREDFILKTTSDQLEQTTLLNRLTWWIAFAAIVAALGAVVAGFSYCLQIWQFFHPAKSAFKI